MLEISMQPVCLLMIFLLFTLLYLIKIDKLIDLIERTFNPTLHVTTKNLKIS